MEGRESGGFTVVLMKLKRNQELPSWELMMDEKYWFMGSLSSMLFKLNVLLNASLKNNILD